MTPDGRPQRRALVTGGAGFIGSHVVDLLLNCRYEVDVVDDLSTGKRENLAPAANLDVLDVRSKAMASVVSNGRYAMIVHLAAQMDVRKSVANPAFDASVNILGTLNVLEAIRSIAPGSRPRFVFSSTGGVLYGDFVQPPNLETFPKDPESPYAISKLSAEYYLAYYARVHALDTVALRYGNVYGPRQNPHGEAGVVAIFCGRILEGRPLTIFGDGKQTRDYVYVSDVADATLRAATAQLPPPERLDVRAFNVGTGIGTSVIRVADVLKSVSGSDVPLEFAPPRPGEQQESYVSVEKAARLLGWTPRLSIEKGLERSFRWFAERLGRSRQSLSTA